MRKNRDWVRTGRLAFRGQEKSAGVGFHAEQRKEIPGDVLRDSAVRFAVQAYAIEREHVAQHV